MLLLDASLHPGLEDRGSQLTLLRFLDDATRKVPVAEFFLTEDAAVIFGCSTACCVVTAFPSASTEIVMASSFVRMSTGRWKNNSAVKDNPPSSVAIWRSWASPTSPPTLPKPRAASSVSGVPSRIVFPANYVWLALPIWMLPIRSSAVCFRTTTGASAAPLARLPKLGVPLPRIWTVSAASFTNVRSATTTSHSGTVAAFKFRLSQNASASLELKLKCKRLF